SVALTAGSIPLYADGALQAAIVGHLVGTHALSKKVKDFRPDPTPAFDMAVNESNDRTLAVAIGREIEPAAIIGIAWERNAEERVHDFVFMHINKGVNARRILDL